MSDERRRAVLCARVSTDSQAEYGRSIATQFEVMRDYAGRAGFDVIAEIQDDISGTVPIRERPGGRRLYEFIDSRRADAVVFFAVDRVTRDEDLIEINVIRRDCRNAGMELHYAADGGKSDLSTWGGVIDTLKAAGAAEERKKIAERTKRGLRAKAESGLWVGNAPEPYGYRKEGRGRDTRLGIHEGEAQTVRRIFTLYTDPNKRHSLREICAMLDREGVPAPGRDTKPGPGKGSGWWPVSLKKIISNRAYIGEVLSMGMLVTLPELALIDHATFERAQTRLVSNKAHAKRNRKRHYLLSSHIKCSCGRAMNAYTPAAGHGRRSYYRCTCYTVPSSRRTCRAPFMPADVIEPLVWREVVGFLDEDKLRRGLARDIERSTQTNEQHQGRISELETLLERAERKLRRLVADGADEEDNNLRAAAKAEARDVSRQLDGYRREIDDLRGQMHAGEITEAQRNAILAQAAQLRELLSHVNFEAQRYILDRLNVSAMVINGEEGRKVKITAAVDVPIVLASPAATC